MRSSELALTAAVRAQCEPLGCCSSAARFTEKRETDDTHWVLIHWGNAEPVVPGQPHVPRCFSELMPAVVVTVTGVAMATRCNDRYASAATAGGHSHSSM